MDTLKRRNVGCWVQLYAESVHACARARVSGQQPDPTCTSVTNGAKVLMSRKRSVWLMNYI